MKKSFYFLVFTALGLTACEGAVGEVNLTGAGATFPYPIYSKWFSEYEKVRPGVRINYSSIGSGGGIRQVLARTVDFGATDAPMKDEQLKKSRVPIIHIPTVLGAVALTYHLPAVKNHQLKLSGPVLADIFLGKVKVWNDPAIARLNPKLKLPAAPILVAHRSDGSGTTAIFSDYLSKVSSVWKTRVGSGTSLDWPVGLGGKGNEGVTGLVKQTPGALGYVELIYAESNGLPVALLQNRSGKFVRPSSESVTAAAAGSLAQMPQDFRVSITNPQGQDAYPIAAFTYLLVYGEMAGKAGVEWVSFLKWAITDGQKFASEMGYARLPSSMVAKIQARIATIRVSALQ